MSLLDALLGRAKSEIVFPKASPASPSSPPTMKRDTLEKINRGNFSKESPQPEHAKTTRECLPKRRPGIDLGTYRGCDDVEEALEIVGYLEALSGRHSATASEIAEKLHGRNYTLERVVEIYRACEALRAAGILISGRDGYGYQIVPGEGRKHQEAKS